MSIDFLDSGIDNKSFLKPEKSGINPFLLENNTKQINEIIQFYRMIIKEYIKDKKSPERTGLRERGGIRQCI